MAAPFAQRVCPSALMRHWQLSSASCSPQPTKSAPAPHVLAPVGHVPWPTMHWSSTHCIPARQAGIQVGPGIGGGGFGVEHGPLRSPSLRRTFATGLATRIVCPLWQIATFLPLPFFPFPLPLPLPPFLASLEIVPRGIRPPRA